MRIVPIWLIILVGLTAACAEREAAVPREVAEHRVLAARHACVGEQLLERAEDDLETIEATMGVAGGIADAATAYQRAFTQHARLRHAVYAHLDSAANHARTSEDSVRHAQRAGQLTILRPAAETLEANILEQYNQRASAILADEGHPCNWRHELEARR
jgi:hypothetical protein